MYPGLKAANQDTQVGAVSGGLDCPQTALCLSNCMAKMFSPRLCVVCWALSPVQPEPGDLTPAFGTKRYLRRPNTPDTLQEQSPNWKPSLRTAALWLFPPHCAGCLHSSTPSVLRDPHQGSAEMKVEGKRTGGVDECKVLDAGKQLGARP